MELGYDRTGTGEPLVLVHGTGSERGVWAPVVPALSREREVLAVDLPGHGSSPPPPGDGPITPRDFAHAVAGQMDRLGWADAHVAGNSLGGWIALELGLLGRARSVAAIAPAGFWTPREFAYVRASLLATQASARLLRPVTGPLTATAVGRTLVGGQLLGRPWAWRPEHLGRAIAGIAGTPVLQRTLDGERGRFEGGERLAGLPVTIGWGLRDRLVFPRQRRRALAALPHARLVTFPDAGHLAMGDRPAEVADAVLKAASPASG